MKKTVKKEATPKVSKSSIKLISYTLGAVIPTEAYGNLQPSMTVEALSIEEAHNYVMPYIQSLIEKFSQNRMPAPNNGPVVKAPVMPIKIPSKSVDPKKNTIEMPSRDTADQLKEFLENDTPAEHYMSEPFKKANQAITSCVSIAALDIITAQVAKSTKLKEDEKVSLYVIIINKRAELSKK